MVSIGDILGNPDRVAFRIVRSLYNAFGYEDDKIPFYESAQDRFVFG